jgi:hypothetical protein
MEQCQFHYGTREKQMRWIPDKEVLSGTMPQSINQGIGRGILLNSALDHFAACVVLAPLIEIEKSQRPKLWASAK